MQRFQSQNAAFEMSAPIGHRVPDVQFDRRTRVPHTALAPCFANCSIGSLSAWLMPIR